jgi:hypothetical protein
MLAELNLLVFAQNMVAGALVPFFAVDVYSESLPTLAPIIEH